MIFAGKYLSIINFTASHNFEGKTIIPFNTNGSGGFGNSINDMKRLAAKARFKEGKSIAGSRVDISREDIQKWAKEIAKK
jgi:flavodoxin